MKFCCDDVSFESLIIMIADKNLISLAQEWERVKGQAMPTTKPTLLQTFDKCCFRAISYLPHSF